MSGRLLSVLFSRLDPRRLLGGREPELEDEWWEGFLDEERWA